MYKIYLTSLLIVSTLLSAPSALAKHKPKATGRKSSGWERGKNNGWRDFPPGLNQEKHRKSKDERPPGWDKGKKEGWQGDLPPGLEKKTDSEVNNDEQPKQTEDTEKKATKTKKKSSDKSNK